MSRYAQARRRNPRYREIPKFLEEFVEDESEKKRKNEELTGKHWLIFIVASCVVAIVSIYLQKSLPEPLGPNEENTRFSEIRAKPILHKLSNIGPKTSGSQACEEDAVNTILEELNKIKPKVELGEHSLEIQTQYPSGCFDIPRFDTDGFGICYKNVSNVIARLGSKHRKWHEEHSAVLINCHYDTWPTSYGGSDDLISCALMMELIRVLGEPRQPPIPHDVIFLFNGAEESSLLAAHGFIVQHPWRHSIKAFINLEASGSGGKELLFQAGPANQWILNSYLEAVVHPHCSVFGQEVFQSGVYPGDTDFRVFRDHGRIPGLDLAFVRNGYWWHTEFDSAELITNGSLQRADIS
uniref:FXNA-like protease n=1 Tax=Acrobeloides nanus TaxID=290746 RepID=A0A914C624_9BILA